MPDYSGMTDDDYREMMQAQAMELAGQRAGGSANDPQAIMPVPPQAPAASPQPAPFVGPPAAQYMVPPGAALPENASAANSAIPNSAQSNAQQEQVAQGQPASENAGEGRTAVPGDPYGRLMALSNANTATTLKAMNQSQGELYKAQEDKADAIRREAAINARTDTDVAKINQGYLNEAHEMRAQQAIANENRQHDVDIELAKQQATIDDIRKSQIDPNDVWKHGAIFGETGSKILAAIGIGLAGMMPGGAEEASNIVNAGINHSINAQRANLDKKKDLLGAQQNIVAIYQQQFANGTQADAAARMALRETAIDTIEQRKLNAKSQLEITNADQMIAGLRAEGAKDTQQFLHITNAIVTNGIMQQGNLLNARSEDQYRNAELGIRALNVKGAKQLPAEEVSKLADLQNSITQVQGLGQTFDQASKASGGKFAGVPLIGGVMDAVPGSGAQKYASARRVIMQLVGKAMEGGILRKEDEEKYSKMFPESGTWNPKAHVMFQTLTSTLQNQLSTKLKTYQQAGYDIGSMRPARQLDLQPGVAQ